MFWISWDLPSDLVFQVLWVQLLSAVQEKLIEAAHQLKAKQASSYKMKVAVVGAGVAGLVAAHTLVVAGVDVVLYEKENTVGGHIGGAATGCVHHEGNDVDVGFTIFNPVWTMNMIKNPNFMWFLV